MEINADNVEFYHITVLNADWKMLRLKENYAKLAILFVITVFIHVQSYFY